MKLLFDENLSRRLLQLLHGIYPESTHPDILNMRAASDENLWELAKKEGYILVSKDNDFRQRSFLYGHPPKVIFLSVGNAGTEAIVRILADHKPKMISFAANPEESLLILQS